MITCIYVNRVEKLDVIKNCFVREKAKIWRKVDKSQEKALQSASFLKMHRRIKWKKENANKENLSCSYPLLILSNSVSTSFSFTNHLKKLQKLMIITHLTNQL